MAINVTCPGCLKRFTVSDKFAGKTGPCPSCQKTIKIPDKSEEVVIHSAEDRGPKDSKGRSVLKPIRRKEVKIGTPVIVGAALAAFSIFAIALGLGLSGSQPPTAVLVIGALLLAFPLVFVGYWFLHDDELEGYNGKQLLIRCGICSIAFALLWTVYGFGPSYVSGHQSLAQISGLDMVIFIPLMLILGTLVSVASLELELLNGFLHSMLYFGVTFILAWLAGTHLAAPLTAGDDSAPDTGVVAPAVPADGGQVTETAPPAAPADGVKVPNLLQ